MIEIKIQDNLVKFFMDGRETPIYFFKKSELASVRNEDGKDVSEWIVHLMLKKWMPDEVLYELASIINEENPENIKLLIS